MAKNKFFSDNPIEVRKNILYRKSNSLSRIQAHYETSQFMEVHINIKHGQWLLGYDTLYRSILEGHTQSSQVFNEAKKILEPLEKAKK